MRLMDLPNDALTEIFGTLTASELAQTTRTSTETSVSSKDSYLWQRKLARHFPESFQKLKDEKSIDWYTQFREISAVEYATLNSSRARKLFSSVKEGDLGRLRQLHQEMPLSLSELDLKDSHNKSLCDWILAQNNQALLDWLFHAMLAYYETYYALHPDATAIDVSTRRNEIYWALISRQGIEVIQQLLKRGLIADEVYFPYTTGYRCQSIHLAAKQGQWDVVQLLISKRPDLVNGYDSEWQRVLHIAASAGNAAMVSYLLLKGAEINARTISGYTPLYCAALEGHHHVVKLLLDQGADIQINGGNHFPIHAAAMKGHLNVMMTLLEHDANLINKLSHIEESSPLSLAMKAGHVTLVEYLLSPERKPTVDVNIGGYSSCKPIKRVFDCKDVTTRHSWIVSLLERDVDISTSGLFTYEREKLYEVTIMKGRLKLVMLLFDKYPELFKNIYDFYSALFMAAKEGQLAIVKYLIKQRIPHSSLWNDNETLNIALEKGHDQIAIELIEAKIIGNRELPDVLKFATLHQRTRVSTFILDKYPHLRLKNPQITNIKSTITIDSKEQSHWVIRNNPASQAKNLSSAVDKLDESKAIEKAKLLKRSRITKAVHEENWASVKTILYENASALSSGDYLPLLENRIKKIIYAMSFLVKQNLVADKMLDLLEKCDESGLALAAIIEQIGRHPPTLKSFALLVETQFSVISKILAADKSQQHILFLCLLGSSQQKYFLQKFALPSERYQLKYRITQMQRIYPELKILLENLRVSCINDIKQNISRYFPLQEVARAVTFLDQQDLMNDYLFYMVSKFDKLALVLTKIIENTEHHGIFKRATLLPETKLQEIAAVLTENKGTRNILYLCSLDFSQQEYYIKQITLPQELYHLKSQITQMQGRCPPLAPFLESLRQRCDDAINQNFSRIFKKYYKENCRFSFFGNTLRSEIGKKVFSDQIITQKEVRSYLFKNSANNLSAKILSVMKANSLCPY